MAFSTLNSTAFSALDAISGGTTLEQLSPDQIKELQGVLKSLGYGLDADGVLGPLTKTVWASFKSDNGLDQPDAIGPSSIALLRQRLSGGAADDVPPQAVTIVKTFEGFSAHAYDDGTGVWTIGYGTTAYPDGGRVASGQTATEAQAVASRGEEYRRYQRTTSPFIPWIPRKEPT